jgi:hypothetical protein
MAAGTAATVITFICSAALAKGATVMTGDAEGSRCCSCYLLSIGSLIVIAVIVTDIVCIVALCRMGRDIVIEV